MRDHLAQTSAGGCAASGRSYLLERNPDAALRGY